MASGEPRAKAPIPVSPAELLATVSHELRQPLAAIRGFTEMLLTHWADFADTDKIEMLKEVLHDSLRVSRLVDELLDVSRLESGQLTLYGRPTNIGDLISRVIVNLKLSYPGLDAIVEIPERFPLVMADPFKLEQVLTNIVENACKYGPIGTVRITGSYAAVAGELEIAISDQGPGISSEELPHVAEKFFRGNESGPNGLGLGLWISKGIVEAHGGRLVTTSVAGEGTTVCFTIPLNRETAEPLPGGSASPGPRRGKKKSQARAPRNWQAGGIMSSVPSALERGQALISDAGSADDLRAVEAEAFGKRSELAAITATLRDLTADQRRDLGRAVQEARATLEQLFAQRMAELEALQARHRAESEHLDLSEAAWLFASAEGPLATRAGQPVPRGHLHLVTQVRQELEDIFVSMGFELAEGPEAEDDWHNFEALNMPPHHPARGMFDTFYLKAGEPESVLLRTHTSPVQVRLMESRRPPIYVVAPGRCFRRDTPDATHLPVFHQLEALVVDEGISMSHLAGTLDAFTNAFFGPGRRARLRPSFFPFTEPSAEFDVTCWVCGGIGCRTCSGSGWIELGGCGMVDPAVFQAVGVDSERYTGFAWGFGIDRLAMVRTDLADLRDLIDNDVRFLSQF